jgi:hypothetical protein
MIRDIAMLMRAWIVAIALVAACKSGKEAGKGPETVQNAANGAIPTPKVTVATVLAKDDGKPPFLLLVDDMGTVRLAAARTWADLDANKLQIAKKTAKLGLLDRYVREDYAMGRDPIDAVKSWDEEGDTDIDLSSLEDTTTRTGAAQDDPPPPEEDKPDDGDESGGTGTAMALDEGKMGNKDSDRAEGQYKMQKVEDPQLARQQAIDQARAAGILGSRAVVGGAGMGAFAKLAPNEDGTPSRVAEVEGVVVKDGKLERLRAMIFIAPTAKATKLIDAVRDTDDAIAVSYNGKIRPLHLQFGGRDSANAPSPDWLEARVSAKGVVVEAVPDKPFEVTALDQLGAAMEKVRAARGGEFAPIDVLVDPDVDVQRLVDVVVALDVAGAKVIGMGPAPSTEQLARRGHRIPMTALGQPNAQGDLDKAEIRRVVKGALRKITYCYEKALLASPTLEGTVQVQFFIKPDGTVPTAAASGVDPEVATCVGNVIKSLAFPKPKGGGGVQVNYPFTMHR